MSFLPSTAVGNWHFTKTLIMQYALMHKWLEHLTHTNIHISPEEEIPQGWDRAICVWKTEHSIQRKTDHRTKIYLNDRAERILRGPQGCQHLGELSHDLSVMSAIKGYHISLHVRTYRYSWYCYKLVKCPVHTRVAEMLCRWVGLGNDTTLRSVMDIKEEAQASFNGHQLQPIVVLGNIVFIHETNKAESVLKAFTARSRAHE